MAVGSIVQVERLFAAGWPEVAGMICRVWCGRQWIWVQVSLEQKIWQKLS